MKVLKSAVIAGALLCFSSALPAFDHSSGTGTVAETMDSAGYTYVQLAEDGRWVAGPPTEVSVGDSVMYSSAVEMGEFHSRTLGRTFEQILFAQSLKVLGPTEADAHADSTMNVMIAEELGITKSADAAAPATDEIPTLEGALSVDAIVTGSQALNGQIVTLSAKVMKVSENILGKNWITLEDGTGTAPDNKLIATSAELVETGDVVTVKGTVHTDVDIGAGYKYKVVLEEATFTK